MEKMKLLGTGISIGKYEKFTSTIMELARKKEGKYICLANVHMLTEAFNDPGFSSIVNNAEIVTPDGQPLSLLLKLLYGVDQDRVAGMDLLPDILTISEKEQISLFFYGATSELLDKVRDKLSDEYPGVKLSGMISPPFGVISPELQKEHLEKINNSGAGIIFIILGCPKQEKMMASMAGKVKGVMIGIGGAVPVFAGEMTRAPRWMQKFYLEWFYRLLQEPGRLWKRYLFTNTKFIVLAIMELIRVRILKKGKSV